MSTHSDNKGTVAPQPIPGAATTHSQQQGRRSSFSAWPPTFFGGMSAPSSRSQAFSNAISPPLAHPFPVSGVAPAATASSQLPENTPTAFSGIGLFRRFSTSGVPAGGSQPLGQTSTQQQQQQHRPPPASELADAIGRHARAELRGDALPQPKVLDEVRGKNDPPSRPDSRMRNLMLSGQFLI
ncbi:hypothetical protein GGF44_000710 [Coemansia sp. RSA 1694]|nr:hypothetical protein GGF38_005681 [Coemansia sp. RSA 25]KAJ2644285.1 hypothetical protein GGF44_000710 [Coemansia sp. RSA 1694]